MITATLDCSIWTDRTLMRRVALDDVSLATLLADGSLLTLLATLQCMCSVAG
jgi:hypothetical protein